MSRPLPERPAMRRVVMERDGNRCFWCDMVLIRRPTKAEKRKHPLPRNFPTLDHVITHQNGGPDTSGNFVLACPGCNRDRGNSDFVTYGIRRITDRAVAEFVAHDLMEVIHDAK